MFESMIKNGKEVLPYLAEIYQQLYLVPDGSNTELYLQIVQKGQDAPVKDLSHFRMHEKDILEITDTPAGPVMSVTLNDRQDFEHFLCIMANKCRPYEIPASQGASILDGLVNWQKIRRHREEWFREKKEEGDLFPDWGEEFTRYTADKNNYRDALIVMSAGPYSNIPSSAFGLGEKEWRDCSHLIRKYHECTHFLCRRKYPDKIDAVWDETVADAVGILAGFGRFDPAAEEIFLGIDADGYIGGRLENYVQNKELLDETARKIHDVITEIAALSEIGQFTDPFAFAVSIEEKKAQWW